MRQSVSRSGLFIVQGNFGGQNWSERNTTGAGPYPQVVLLQTERDTFTHQSTSHLDSSPTATFSTHHVPMPKDDPRSSRPEPVHRRRNHANTKWERPTSRTRAHGQARLTPVCVPRTSPLSRTHRRAGRRDHRGTRLVQSRAFRSRPRTRREMRGSVARSAASALGH
jgi:hypothetical protein